MAEAQYYECPADKLVVNDINDFLDLIGKVYKTGKLLMYQANFNPDFFDLSTGLAGEILQKMVNYQIHTAIIIDPNTIKSERFKELMSEANHYSEYRFCTERETAISWLEQV